VAAKQIIFSPPLEFDVRVEGAMHGYMAGVITDGIKILPLAVPPLGEQGAEARYARTLGIESWNGDGKVERSDGAPGLPGFSAKLFNQRGGIAHRLGSESGVMPIRVQGKGRKQAINGSVGPRWLCPHRFGESENFDCNSELS
jgi:hypothetical protein